MDNSRLILAIVLCMGVLLGWGKFSEYMGWTPPPPTPQTAERSGIEGQPPVPVPAPVVPAPPPEIVSATASPGHSIRVTTPLYEAELHSSGGFLESFRLTRFGMEAARGDTPVERVNLIGPTARGKASLGILLDGRPTWSDAEWSVADSDLNLRAGQTGSIRLIGLVNDITITREMTFHADTYLITDRISLSSEQDRLVRLGLTVSAEDLSFGAVHYNETRAAWHINNSLKEEAKANNLSRGLTASGDIQWAGIMSSYFLAAVAPADTANLGLRARLEDNVFRAVVEKSDLRLNAGQPIESNWSYWIGPKNRELLSVAPNELSAAINLGWFSVIASALLWLLNYFYGYVGNYGVAIILLTVLIKIILYPLSYKSYKSMSQMKKLQPMIEKIREKHGDDRQAMGQETMALYRTYKINPASGCIPILLQLPIFIGLYQALLNAIELRHAPFITTLPFTDLVWIVDLSVRDPYYITPIVMGATMLLQQKLTPIADPMQAKIMMLMPIVFLFIFLSFPAGLVLYWLVNNVLSIAQQWWMLRKD
jgi:YidC/Oxa1 family membrane protein insertase